ncbi:MAG: hypothetical protein HN380_26580 [Victivallales bacterium]|nr:hypothetical protein [Victivallales bacterium]
MRHYAKSTEKTYLHWSRRFLAYCRETRGGGRADGDRRQGVPDPLGHGREGERLDAEPGLQCVAAALPQGAAHRPGGNGTDRACQTRAQIADGVVCGRSAATAGGGGVRLCSDGEAPIR